MVKNFGHLPFALQLSIRREPWGNAENRATPSLPKHPWLLSQCWAVRVRICHGKGVTPFAHTVIASFMATTPRTGPPKLNPNSSLQINTHTEKEK